MTTSSRPGGRALVDALREHGLQVRWRNLARWRRWFGRERSLSMARREFQRYKPDLVFAFNRANTKTGQIIIAGLIHSGHFRGFPANQRASRLLTAIRDTGDNLFGNAVFQKAGCKIVEKKERFSALYNQIVDTHGNQINSDCVVNAGVDGNFQLGADAIIGSHQQRVAIAGRRQVKNAAKTADRSVCTGAAGRCNKGFDGMHQGIAGININAGIGIGERWFVCFHNLLYAARAVPSCTMWNKSWKTHRKTILWAKFLPSDTVTWVNPDMRARSRKFKFSGWLVLANRGDVRASAVKAASNARIRNSVS